MKKRINNSGFLLVEAIIVGVFIFALFTLIYVGVTPLFGEYSGKKNVNHVRSIYKTNEIRNFIIWVHEVGVRSNIGVSQEQINTSCRLYGGSKVVSNDTSYFKEYLGTNKLCSTSENNLWNHQGVCNDLLTQLKVKDIYASSYNIEKLRNYAVNCYKQGGCNMGRAMMDYLRFANVRNKDDTILHQTTRRIFVEYLDGSVGEAEVRFNDYKSCG